MPERTEGVRKEWREEKGALSYVGLEGLAMKSPAAKGAGPPSNSQSLLTGCMECGHICLCFQARTLPLSKAQPPRMVAYEKSITRHSNGCRGPKHPPRLSTNIS